ncbi:hypothetical protein V500_03420 [Pseudogymnoascus sp. VKM F-4518 (FW-2643)]|nr:hypothetical protein V500_03420 [Pseudogymnoascus sp. VKM F-4518 (FW-2643)]
MGVVLSTPRDNGKSLVYDRGTLLSASGADSSAYDHESIVDDIDGSIHPNVAGFYDKFFGGKSWTSDSQKVVSSVDLDDFKTRSSKIESPIALCLLLQEVLRLNGRDVVYCPVQTLPDEPPPRQSGGIALFSAIKELEPRAEVVGVFRPGEASDYKDGLFELCGHARAVFSRRPDRLFVHGFYIFGNIMECWMFDRSGIYGCEPFDITEHPERFLTIMAGYASMSDQEWGRSNFIKKDSVGIYVCVEDDKKMLGKKMYLETPPFFIRDEETIVRGSLLCHRGRESSAAPWNFVVKYKWKPPWHEPEAEHLKKVRDRNVWGVVQFHSYEVIDKTEDLRSGLIFGPPQQFKDEETVEQTAESKEMSAAAIGAKALLETFEEDRPNLPKSPGYRITVFSCLIISPPGTSIFEYANLHQLLEVFRDAIKAHRSLYQDGGILHRDIAASNIIIPPPTTSEGSPKGMLIDLDTAWDTGRGPTPQGSMVGTSPFMAIGALEAYVQNNPRTYRHDLESFFYVFLFIAICPREEDGSKAEALPETSRLLQWRQDKRKQVRKTADMGKEGFNAILEEFSPEFEGLKKLARTLRGILFPLKDGKIWTWTDISPEGTDKLYDDMIGAFKDALLSIAVVPEIRYPAISSNDDIKAPGSTYSWTSLWRRGLASQLHW